MEEQERGNREGTKQHVWRSSGQWLGHGGWVVQDSQQHPRRQQQDEPALATKVDRLVEGKRLWRSARQGIGQQSEQLG